MTCNECLELIAALEEHDGDPSLAEQVKSHIAHCDACAGEAQAVAMLRERLEQAGDSNRNRALADEVMRRIAPKRRPALHWYLNRVAACFVVLASVFLARELVWPSAKRSNDATVAAMAHRVRDAESLSFTVTSQGKQHSQQLNGMMLGQQAMRFELPEKRVVIVDLESKESLMLLTDKGQAIRNPEMQIQPLNFRAILLGLLPNVIDIVGVQEFEGVDVLVIRAPWPKELGEPEKWKLMASINLRTGLPIRVEATWGDEGDDDWRQLLFSNIVFDAPLDPGLFSLEPPDGYALIPSSADPKMAAMSTASNMRTILMACMIYQHENNGRWPDRLDQLVIYLSSEDVLKNSRDPNAKIGYVYRRPSANAPMDSTAVLWEKHDEWGAGVNVGYLDGHIEFVSEKAKFDALIGGDQ